MLTTKLDAIRARALGVALDAHDEKDAVVKELRRSIDMMWDDCEEWRKAFMCMRGLADKWKRRWCITFAALLGVIVGVFYIAMFVRL